MRLVLYQPDIPQNTGTILRLAACLDIPIDIIGPTGFAMTDRNLRRSGLDYIDKIKLTRHLDWDDFYREHSGGQQPHSRPGGKSAADLSQQARQSHRYASGRLILLTTRSNQSYLDFRFREDDKLLLGRESAGVPDHVHDSADARLTIPMHAGFRSLNIAVAAAMVLGEALRQTDGFALRGSD